MLKNHGTIRRIGPKKLGTIQKIRPKNDGRAQKKIQNDGSHQFGQVLKLHFLVKMHKR